MNNSQLLNNPIKTEDERNNFNFSGHRRPIGIRAKPVKSKTKRQAPKYIRIPLSSKIPYPIVNRVRFEITTHETGLKSYKLPQEEADRIECVLKGGLQFTM